MAVKHLRFIQELKKTKPILKPITYKQVTTIYKPKGGKKNDKAAGMTSDAKWSSQAQQPRRQQLDSMFECKYIKRNYNILID